MLPGPLAEGGLIGFDRVAESGIDPELMRHTVETAPAASVILVNDTDRRLVIEPDRSVYRLDTDGLVASVNLETIIGGADQQLIYLTGYDARRLIALGDDVLDAESESVDDSLILSGGSLSLRPEDIIAVRYIADVKRWLEVGRLLAAKPYMPVPSEYAAAVHSHDPGEIILPSGAGRLVTAAAVIADKAVVIGDGGVRGVKGAANISIDGSSIIGPVYVKVFTHETTMLEFISAGSSAVNWISISNHTTGNAPTLAARGTDANVDLEIRAKGTGVVRIYNPAGLGEHHITFLAVNTPVSF